MQACPRQNAPAGDLGGGRGPEGGLRPPEIAEAGLRRWLGTQQRPEGAPVHGADRAMPDDGKHQRRDVVAPMDFVAQAVARPVNSMLAAVTLPQRSTDSVGAQSGRLPLRARPDHGALTGIDELANAG